MPTRCTAAATCSGIRNRWPPLPTHAGKPDKPDRTSGPEQAPPSKPSRSSKSPKPECASEPPSGHARRSAPFALRPLAGFSDRKQTGPFVPSQFTFARLGQPSGRRWDHRYGLRGDRLDHCLRRRRQEAVEERCGPGIGIGGKNFPWRGLLFDSCQATIEGCTCMRGGSTND